MHYPDGTLFIHVGSGQKFILIKGKWTLVGGAENFVNSTLSAVSLVEDKSEPVVDMLTLMEINAYAVE